MRNFSVTGGADRLFVLFFSILMSHLAGCSKPKKAEHRVTSTTQTPTETIASSSSLAIGYPEGLSISSGSTTAPTASTTDATTVTYASSSLAIPTTISLTSESYDPTSVTPKDRIASAAKRLTGAASECLSAAMFDPVPVNSPSCYNPDGDLATVNQAYSGAVGSNPKFPTGGGLTANGEACLAAYSRGKMAEVASIVDQGQALVEGMICAAYKSNADQELPKVNETIDLTSPFAMTIGAQVVAPGTDMTAPEGAAGVVVGPPPLANFRIMKAQIKRLDDTTDRATFLSEIIMEVNGTVREIRLMHSPSLKDGNSNYQGRLSIRTIKVQTSGLAQNHQDYLDLNYMLSLDTEDGNKPKTRYRLTRAMFNHAALKALAVDPFAGLGQLDLNVGVVFSGQPSDAGYGRFATDQVNDLNLTMAKVNLIDYQGNPLTNEGRLSFWVNPGGNYNEAARGFVADRKRESADSTRLVGCAISGAALAPDFSESYSIRKAQKTGYQLKPTGYYHPDGQDDTTSLRVNAKCAAGDCQRAPYVFKQCFRQNNAGAYVPFGNTDTAKQYDIINVTATPEVVNDRMPVVDGKLGAPK
jgi:hypothetical protein